MPMHANPGPGPVQSEPGGARWLTVGSSAVEDSWSAGVAATRAALRDGGDGKLLMVFCSALYDPEAVLAGIRLIAPGVPLIGCSSAAVISADEVGEGVVVVALGGPGFSVATGLGLNAEGRQRAVGAEVAGCSARVVGHPHRVMIMLTDGLVSAQEEILAGAYGVVGASVPLVGGTASPDPAEPRTFQLHGDQVLSGGAVGAIIASDGPLGIGLRHGWRKVGEPMIVTKSHLGEVYTLDDRPAVQAYLQRLGAPDDAYIDRAAFEKFAENRPIGLRRRSGEMVRNVGSATHLARGWLHSSGDVPEGGLIWPMEGDEASVLAAADDACRDAAAALGGRTPLGLIAFDCETRSRFLGVEGRRREVALMAQRAGAVPLAGLYTWGEIARTSGINGFHNQTLVVLAIG
jgi:hypothetical protein